MTQPCTKTQFKSAAIAKHAATTISRRNGDRRMRPYLCEHCRKYHLAHVGRTI